ncbi:MAG: DUF6077 domain-containing protein [Candidatus Eisenbacteria bacterium]
MSKTRRVLSAFGVTAILALLGLLKILPYPVSFYIGSTAILLFPGMVLWSLIMRKRSSLSFPEWLAVTCVLGTGVLALVAFVGLVLNVRLAQIITSVCIAYGGLTVLVIIKRIPVGAATSAPVAGRKLSAAEIAILVIAVAASLVTLVTPRDSDDWYYLAHIADYTTGNPLRAEDAIFGMENPVSPRSWYGGWWVVEALLSQTTGVHPVAAHQVFLPVLVVFFSVLAMYSFAKGIFGSEGAALIACTLQVLFYLSAIFPSNCAGGMFFIRSTQDKGTALLLMVPVVVALALRVIDGKRGYPAYFIALVASTLVHPLGPVWCGLAIVPFAFVELLRHRRRDSVRRLALIIFPFLVCGMILLSGMGAVTESLGREEFRERATLDDCSLRSIYMPGDPFEPSAYACTRVLQLSDKLWVTNPGHVLRFPMAIAGLVLTCLLVPVFRTNRPARFLFCLTVVVLAGAFTPVGSEVFSKLITAKMVFRLAWILPWGFTIAFFIWRLNRRSLVKWTIVAVMALTLARGNPVNYLKVAYGTRDRGRPTPDIVDAFGALGAQHSPQGLILAPVLVGRMLPAYVPDAYPAAYRGSGSMSLETSRRLLVRSRLDDDTIAGIVGNGIRYILLGHNQPLAAAIGKSVPGFVLLFRNQSYSLWEVDHAYFSQRSQS